MSTPAEQLPQQPDAPPPPAEVPGRWGGFSPHEEEERGREQLMGDWDPWHGPTKPSFWAGMGFSEDTAYLGPFYRALQGAANGAARGVQLLSPIGRYLGTSQEQFLSPEEAAGGGVLPPSEQQAEADRANIRATVKATTPDPATTGAAAEILHGLASGMARFTAGGAPLIGATEAQGRYEEMREAGVSPGAAGTSAAAAGLLGAAGALLPAGLGKGLATRVLTGGAGNVGFGLLSRGTDWAVLKASGYDDMAQQQAVFDRDAILADAVLGSGFGYMHHRGEVRAEAQRKQWESIRKLADEIRQSPGAEDAALTTQLAAADRASAPGVPVDPGATNAHQRALETATEQLSAGEPVNVSDTGIDEAAFLPRPGRDLSEAHEVLVNALRESGVPHEEASLRALQDTLGRRYEGAPPPTDEELEAMAPREEGAPAEPEQTAPVAAQEAEGAAPEESPTAATPEPARPPEAAQEAQPISPQETLRRIRDARLRFGAATPPERIRAFLGPEVPEEMQDRAVRAIQREGTVPTLLPPGMEAPILFAPGVEPPTVFAPGVEPPTVHPPAERPGSHALPAEQAGKTSTVFDAATGRVQQLTSRAGEVSGADLLDAIRGDRSSKPDAIGSLANFIKSRLGADTRVVVHDDESFLHEGRQVAGHYDSATNTITLGRNASARTVLHETVHAITSRFIEANPNNPVTRELQDLFNHVKREIKGDMQGIKDIHEFLAEAMSSPAFQEALAGIKAPKGPGTVWNTLVSVVKKMLGAGKAGVALKDSALNHAMKLADVISNAPQRSLKGAERAVEGADKAYIAHIGSSPAWLENHAIEELARGNYTLITLSDGTRARLVHVRQSGHGLNSLVAVAPVGEHPFATDAAAARDLGAFGGYTSESAWPAPARPAHNIGRLYYSTEDVNDVRGGPGLRHNPNITVSTAHQGKGVATRLYQEAEANGGLIPYATEKLQRGDRTEMGKGFRGAMGSRIGTRETGNGTVLPVSRPKATEKTAFPDTEWRQKAAERAKAAAASAPDIISTPAEPPIRQVDEVEPMPNRNAHSAYNTLREGFDEDQPQFVAMTHVQLEEMAQGAGIPHHNIEILYSKLVSAQLRAGLLDLRDGKLVRTDDAEAEPASPTQQALREHPHMEIPSPDGTTVPATQELQQADRQLAEGQQDLPKATSAAAVCAARKGNE